MRPEDAAGCDYSPQGPGCWPREPESTTTPDEQKLMNLMQRLAELVGSVHGVVTASEAAERDRLEQKLGKRWDWQSGWQPLEDER